MELHSQELSLSMFSLEGYHALREGAGVVRRGDRGILAVTGRDRLTWLQGLLTNDVTALPMGGVCDAAYLTPQGRMIAELRVINLPDRTLLDVPGSLAEALRAKLEGLLFSEDAQIVDISKSVAVIDVHGPNAPRVVREVSVAIGSRATVLTDAAYGIPGYSILTAAADVVHVVSHLVASGARETTLETLEVIRVEAGRPAFLIDMDEHTIPLEAGIEQRVISFTKGCYVGQEVIVRVTQRGHGRVAKKLVGLKLEKAELPKHGDGIAAGDREIGRITSSVWSPRLESGIALGYVHRDFMQPGATLSVRAASGPITGTVSLLPFVPS